MHKLILLTRLPGKVWLLEDVGGYFLFLILILFSSVCPSSWLTCSMMRTWVFRTTFNIICLFWGYWLYNLLRTLFAVDILLLVSLSMFASDEITHRAAGLVNSFQLQLCDGELVVILMRGLCRASVFSGWFQQLFQITKVFQNWSETKNNFFIAGVWKCMFLYTTNLGQRLLWLDLSKERLNPVCKYQTDTIYCNTPW